MVEGDSEKGEPVEVKGGCPHRMPCFSPCVAKFRKGGKLVATATNVDNSVYNSVYNSCR